MADYVTLDNVITNKVWHHLVELAQGYLINLYLLRSALTERKTKRRVSVHTLHSLYHGGDMT